MSDIPGYILLSLVMCFIGAYIGATAIEKEAQTQCDEIGVVRFHGVYYTCGKRP